MSNRIAPRSGTAFELAKGDTVRDINIEGQKVSDLFALAKEDTREVISNGHTIDDAGQHDFELTPCSTDTCKHFYPDKPVHCGCFGNLVQALDPWDIGSDAISTAFNIFMNVPVSRSRSLEAATPKSRAGDVTELRAQIALVIGLTACSAYASNGGSFKPIGYEVLSA